MKNNIKPIKPTDVFDEKLKTIPDAMIDAVNKMIALKWNGEFAIIKKDELLKKYFEIAGLDNDRPNTERLYEKHSLDFEEAYRREGWDVYYNYPIPSAGDSDFEPFYKFTIKNKR